jgi:hypothetical protein
MDIGWTVKVHVPAKIILHQHIQENHSSPAYSDKFCNPLRLLSYEYKISFLGIKLARM